VQWGCLGREQGDQFRAEYSRDETIESVLHVMLARVAVSITRDRVKTYLDAISNTRQHYLNGRLKGATGNAINSDLRSNYAKVKNVAGGSRDYCIDLERSSAGTVLRIIHDIFQYIS
jgi:hypothetical protein